MTRKRVRSRAGWIATLSLTLLVIAGCTSVAVGPGIEGQTAAEQVGDDPEQQSISTPPGQVELSATEHNFGTIANTEPVTKVFLVRNVGNGELQITGLSTSCGCTTAEISSRRLAPGEVADLSVTYDPLAHGGATGEFMRVVYLRSNDPSTPEARLIVRVTVVEGEQVSGETPSQAAGAGG